MATAYSWHSGAVRLKSIWAVPTPLLPDEIFSSWLVRAAFDNGMEPMGFTDAIWKKSRLWTIDIDRHLSNDQISTIAKLSGLDSFQVHNSMLSNVVSRFPDQLIANKKQLQPWVLALGSRNRARLGGMQYCPHCLAEDETPYFKLNWRFAWHVACQKHQCALLDRCPHCKAAIQFHKRKFITTSPRHCAICNRDLTNVSSKVGFLPAIQLQLATDNCLISKNKPIIMDWFQRLRLFEGLVRRQYRNNPIAVSHFFKLSNIPINTNVDLTELGLAFEMLGVSERSLYLSKVMPLMEMSPETLLNNLLTTNVTQQAFCAEPLPIPESLKNVMAKLLDGTRNPKKKSQVHASNMIPAPKSKRQVERTLEQLKRKMAGLSNDRLDI